MKKVHLNQLKKIIKCNPSWVNTNKQFDYCCNTPGGGCISKCVCDGTNFNGLFPNLRTLRVDCSSALQAIVNTLTEEERNFVLEYTQDIQKDIYGTRIH